MVKLHLDLSIGSAIPNAYCYSAQCISRLSGLNLGNLVFRHALYSMVEGSTEHEPVDYPGFRKRLGEGALDEVLVSCANWLGTTESDEASNKFRADLIEPLDCPVVCFGLGVQAPHDTDLAQLGPETVRLAKILASKANLLSVRDKLTARSLAAIGIENVCVTGCPSNFINTSTNLGVDLLEKTERLADAAPDWASTRVAISEFSGGSQRSGIVLRRLLEVISAAPSFYVVQSPELLPFLFNETDGLPGSYIVNSNRSVGELKQLMRSRCLAFSSVESWMDFSRTCALSFGMRIHGTIVPLQAGVPSLLISHDSRTSGLAHEMGIPSLSLQAFLDTDTTNPTGIINAIYQQIGDYDSHRKRLAPKWRDFIRSNGLTASPALERLCGSSGN